MTKNFLVRSLNSVNLLSLFKFHSDKTWQIVRQTIRLRLVPYPLNCASGTKPTKTTNQKPTNQKTIPWIRSNQCMDLNYLVPSKLIYYKETSVKQTINKENHSPRPRTPWYSDLLIPLTSSTIHSTCTDHHQPQQQAKILPTTTHYR